MHMLFLNHRATNEKKAESSPDLFVRHQDCSREAAKTNKAAERFRGFLLSKRQLISIRSLRRNI